MFNCDVNNNSWEFSVSVEIVLLSGFSLIGFFIQTHFWLHVLVFFRIYDFMIAFFKSPSSWNNIPNGNPNFSNLFDPKPSIEQNQGKKFFTTTRSIDNLLLEKKTNEKTNFFDKQNGYSKENCQQNWQKTVTDAKVLLFWAVLYNMGTKSSTQLGAFFHTMSANWVHVVCSRFWAQFFSPKCSKLVAGCD